jgi:transposase
VDTDKGVVIWNDKGRKSEVLDRYYRDIGEENCKKIESVATDGAKNYISSTNRYALNAIIVYDKFHVIGNLHWILSEPSLKASRKRCPILLTGLKRRLVLLYLKGINNKIKRLKRMAYGYKDIDYFKLKIHQHCGLLNPRRYAT